MYILGVNSGPHDTAAALIKDGQLVCMIEQERLSRRKKAFGEAPVDAIKACLGYANISLEDIHTIAVGWDVPFAAKNLNMTYDERTFSQWLLPSDQISYVHIPPLHFVPHHLAHAASAFWTSGFDRAAILIIDGAGETKSTTTAIGSSSGIHPLFEWSMVQSLGVFYSMASEWAGLSFWDAGKLMGLAAYGHPDYPMPLVPSSDGYTFLGAPKPFRRIVRHEMQQRSVLEPHFFQTYPFAPNRAGDKSEIMAYANFAASVQKALEEAVTQLAHVTCKQAETTNLIIVGGVALNCTLNGYLSRSRQFNDIYVPPFPHDAGVSLGAALMLHHQLNQNTVVRLPRLEHAYWAPPLQDHDVSTTIQASGLPAQELDEMELVKRVAKHLSNGYLVGWLHGRAEVGQRALGARSILGDPRQRSQLVRINRLKGREIWRPLAPSILEEYAADVFGPDLPSITDFMLAAWPIRTEIQRLLPAVVHVDGTARPQIVRHKVNPRFWHLINEFREITGVPAIINTSFNLAGEPIVYSAADAIKTFRDSELDVLVLDDFILEKPHILFID